MLPTRACGGRFARVADPDWPDPLDASFAKARGGRWNAPGGFEVLYLNADVRTARAYLQVKYQDEPYGPEDLKEDAAPILVWTTVPDGEALDVIREEAVVALGLPVDYPLDEDGNKVRWEVCQLLGKKAHDAGLDGVAARSASPGHAEEFAYFPRGRAVPVDEKQPFEDWYWGAA